MMFKRVVAVAGLSLAAGVAMADCTYLAPNNGSIVRTQPLLGGNLTVGRDVPLGAEIYRQTFTLAGNYAISCSAGLYNIETRRLLPVTPLPLSVGRGRPTGVAFIRPVCLESAWHFGTRAPRCRSPAASPIVAMEPPCVI